MFESEMAIRTLFKENRFSRRILGGAFKDFLELSKMGQISSRCMKSISGVGYVYFAYGSSSALEERKCELLARCFALRFKYNECFTVIGIGVNIPGQNIVTKDGEDMGRFNDILQKAVVEIMHVFQK